MARLAFVYPTFENHGGGEKHTLNCIQALSDNGHHVTLFTASYNTRIYPAATRDGFEIVELGGRGFMEGAAGTLQMTRKLSQLLRGYDTVVASSFPAHIWSTLGNHGVPVVWLCLEPKRNLYQKVMYREAVGFQPKDFRKVSHYINSHTLSSLLLRDAHVLMPYSVRAFLQRQLDMLAVRRMKHILVCSPYIQRKVEEIYRHNRITVIWSGISINPTPGVRADPVILVPTRLEPIKNVENVIHATNILKHNGKLKDFRIVVVGNGSEANRLTRMCENMNLNSEISFTGFINDNALSELYRRSSMVVYPSLAEPLGLPCAEAALYAKPVIADYRGGPADIVVNGKTGILVDMQDPVQLSEAIFELTHDTNRAQDMGIAGQDHVEQTMSYEKWAEKFIVSFHNNIHNN